MFLGGAVSSGDSYGGNASDGSSFPPPVMDRPDDGDKGTGSRGRLIPSTSVEQYAATPARWYGLPAADTPGVFPNIVNFPVPTLGFMQH
jgi:hypothetical protein